MTPHPPSAPAAAPAPAAPLQSRADAHGLVCPRCGCRHFAVLYTRRAWGGRLLRRRTCRHCGRRMTTYEQPAGEIR